MELDTKEAIVESNVSNDNVVEMGVDEEGMYALMHTLTNLYSDPELAVIRETVSNGIDSHVEAGQDRPVEVTLPRWDNPVFVVKDFGLGMDEYTIKKVYSKYGASTKRKSNALVGAYGLGCKSPLTIATQFTLQSVKDGLRHTVLISKTESGISTVNIVSTIETNESNGVTVTIPIPQKDLYKFESKARTYFKYGDPSLILVNGKAPDNIVEGATELTDSEDPDFIGLANFDQTSYYSDTYVVMGNVPYVLDKEQIKESCRRQGLEYSYSYERIPAVFYVNIGDVDLTPPREGLRYTEKTIAVVDKLIASYFRALKHTAQMEMDTLVANGDRHLALETYEKWRRAISLQLTWDGNPVPKALLVEGGVRTIERVIDGKSSHSMDTHISFPMETEFIITNCSMHDNTKVSRHLTPYLQSRGLDSGTFHILGIKKGDSNIPFMVESKKDISDSPWITENERFEFIDYDVLVEQAKKYKAENKAPKPKKVAAPKEKASYRVYDVENGTSSYLDYDVIPVGIPYIYSKDIEKWAENPRSFVSGGVTYHNRYKVQTFSSSIRSVTDAKQVILLGGPNSPKALEKRIPTTYNILQDVEKAVRKVNSKRSDTFLKYHALKQNPSYRQLIEAGVQESSVKILDPDVRDAINVPKNTEKALQSVYDLQRALQFFQFNKQFRVVPQSDVEVVNLEKRYPLLNAFSWRISGEPVKRDHVVHYLNGAYLALNK